MKDSRWMENGRWRGLYEFNTSHGVWRLLWRERGRSAPYEARYEGVLFKPDRSHDMTTYEAHTEDLQAWALDRICRAVEG